MATINPTGANPVALPTATAQVAQAQHAQSTATPPTSVVSTTSTLASAAPASAPATVEKSCLRRMVDTVASFFQKVFSAIKYVVCCEFFKKAQPEAQVAQPTTASTTVAVDPNAASSASTAVVDPNAQASAASTAVVDPNAPTTAQAPTTAATSTAAAPTTPAATSTAAAPTTPAATSTAVAPTTPAATTPAAAPTTTAATTPAATAPTTTAATTSASPKPAMTELKALGEVLQKLIDGKDPLVSAKDVKEAFVHLKDADKTALATGYKGTDATHLDIDKWADDEQGLNVQFQEVLDQINTVLA